MYQCVCGFKTDILLEFDKHLKGLDKMITIDEAAKVLLKLHDIQLKEYEISS